MMKTLLAAAAAALFATTLHAETLTFDGATCNGDLDCGSGLALDQSHGDTALVDVTYDGDDNIDGLQNVLYWDGGYEAFSSVIYTNGGSLMRIDIVPILGYEIAVSRVGVAPFANRLTTNTLTIAGMSLGTVATETYDPVPTFGGEAVNTYLDVDAPQYDADGYSVFFGTQAFNAGLGSIEYDVRRINPIAPVPLPAAAWMLLAGIAALLGARRLS